MFAMNKLFRKIKSWFRSLKPKSTPPVNSGPVEPVIDSTVKLPSDLSPILSGKKKTQIDFAVQVEPGMPVRGDYKNGWPMGAVVHFTAGRRGGRKKAIDGIKSGAKNGFTYLVIGDDGTVTQGHPVDKFGWHSGESKWPGLRSPVHNDLIGIEVQCAGKLEHLGNGKLQTWFETPVEMHEARKVTESEWGCPTGYYEKFTDQQEAALMRVLLWLKKNDPTGNTFDFNFVVGHHEVSGKAGIGRWRKNDPGGSLSMPMFKFRQRLIEQYAFEQRS